MREGKRCKRIISLLLVCCLILQLYPAVSAKAETSSAVAVRFNADGSITIEWNKIIGVTGYQIYYAAGKTGKYSKLITVNNSTAAYTTKPLKNGVTYYFKIRGYIRANGKNSFMAFTKPMTAKSVKVTKYKVPNWHGVFTDGDNTIVMLQNANTGTISLRVFDKNMTALEFFNSIKPTEVVKGKTLKMTREFTDQYFDGELTDYHYLYEMIDNETLKYTLNLNTYDNTYDEQRVYKRIAANLVTYNTDQKKIESPWAKVEGTYEVNGNFGYNNSEYNLSIKVGHGEKDWNTRCYMDINGGKQYLSWYTEDSKQIRKTYPVLNIQLEFYDVEYGRVSSKYSNSILEAEAVGLELEYLTSEYVPDALGREHGYPIKLKLSEDGKQIKMTFDSWKMEDLVFNLK